MIKSVTTHHIVCDGCGKNYPNNKVNKETFFDFKTVLTACVYAGWAKVDGKIYCPECYEHNVKAGKYN